MKDEKYVFISDVREKKTTARSARNQRTHNGKRGRVKLPSDYLTKKELKAMSGEVKSYRLNDPMKWKEFKSMPDDLKVTYIKLIRERYNPYDASISEMMGVHRVTFANEMKRLNLGVGKHHGGKRLFDEDGWLRWCMGIPATNDEVSNEQIIEPELVCECEELPQKFQDREYTPIVFANEPIEDEDEGQTSVALEKAIPCSGKMTFNGSAEAALRSILNLLGGANVHMCITWEALDE